MILAPRAETAHFGALRQAQDLRITPLTKPEIAPMTARIFKPAKTAMSSGTANTKDWVLEFLPSQARAIDPLMGWTSSSDMDSQVHLHFDTADAAKDYAKDHGIDAVVLKPKARKPNIRPGGYGDNFATNRRGVWTH